MSEAPIWLTEADVVSLIDMEDAITALEAGLAQEAAQTACNMVKTHVLWNDGDTLHAIGAVFKLDGFACTKTWTNTKLGSAPILSLFDAADGSLKAVLEAMALGQLRTGGVTGVATKWLAQPGASEAALIGTLACFPVALIRKSTRHYFNLQNVVEAFVECEARLLRIRAELTQVT